METSSATFTMCTRPLVPAAYKASTKGNVHSNVHHVHFSTIYVRSVRGCRYLVCQRTNLIAAWADGQAIFLPEPQSENRLYCGCYRILRSRVNYKILFFIRKGAASTPRTQKRRSRGAPVSWKCFGMNKDLRGSTEVPGVGECRRLIRFERSSLRPS